MRSTRWGTRRFTARRCLPAANPSKKAQRRSASDALQLDPNIEIYGGTNYRTGAPISNYHPPAQLGGAVPPNFRSSPFFPTSFANAYVNRFNPFILPDQLQKSSQKVDFWRANGGLRGDLGFGDWRYDGNVQVSRTRANEKLHNPTRETMSNVLMTTVAPAGTPAEFITTALPRQAEAGTGFTCASNVTNGAYNGGTCIPLDIFNPAILIGGDVPQALYDYLFVPQVQRTKFNQETLSLVFDGTVVDLPAGPLRAAVGFEYRHDKIVNTPSVAAQNGQLYNRTNEGITRGSDNVKEAYAEINIPLLKDKPLANSLEVAASGRYTDYKSYGSGFVYRAERAIFSGRAAAFPGEPRHELPRSEPVRAVRQQSDGLLRRRQRSVRTLSPLSPQPARPIKTVWLS